MREADRTVSRRTFLRRMMVGGAVASTALVVGEEVWEALERLAPRRLLMPGSEYPLWGAGTSCGERLTMKKIRQAQASIYGVTIDEWDRILREEYSKPIVSSLARATPFTEKLRSVQHLRPQLGLITVGV